ncbi:MAG: DUF1735 and LamG domain-containing protein [Tannerellaceae bacterium]|nr:DUF1735 and LamG domain-containing protein [Tannerellaceae bacterium]
MKTTIFFSLLLTGCILCMITACSEGDKFDYNRSAILVTGTEVDPIVKFVVEDTPSSYAVTASATTKATEDVIIKFAHDPSLVEAYNTVNKTSYYPVPDNTIQIEGNEGIIKAGSAGSTGITVKVISTDHLIDGRVYVIPVTIREVEGGDMDVLESSRTIYLRISRIMQFWSLDMNNPNLYSNYIAPDELAVNLTNYTYEIKCYINAWHTTPEQISRLCSFTAKDESNSNMLRFGENGQDINSLQWINPGGGLISNTRFSTEKWYTISLTYDGSKFIMYVDGVKDSEMSGSAECTFQRLELGMSWESYPSKQYFNGRIAEARVWNRALSASELRLGLCGVDPQAEGLVAYWKFDEGEGHIFYDKTEHGYDIDWSKTYRDTGNGEMTPFDKSNYVSWILDDINKCAQ